MGPSGHTPRESTAKLHKNFDIRKYELYFF